MADDDLAYGEIFNVIKGTKKVGGRAGGEEHRLASRFQKAFQKRCKGVPKVSRNFPKVWLKRFLNASGNFIKFRGRFPKIF